VLPEPVGDGAHTAATAVGVRGAAADITGMATAVGVMAHGGGGAIIIERVSTLSPLSHCDRPLIEIDYYGERHPAIARRKIQRPRLHFSK
jgi:hypothetical protein